MSNLISRQAAIDAADKIIKRDTSGNNDVVRAMTAWKVYVEGLPSVQPEIVRCGECKYYDEKDHNCLDEMAYARCWMPTDFCSFGERREDDAAD